jgi:hypothetical protein
MSSLGFCAQCGKSIAQGKKTCGATMAVCTRCKLPIHPHCLGEHRLMHRNQERVTQSLKVSDNPIISKIISFIRTRILFIKEEKPSEN